jgi:hypothetical protein
MAITYTWNINAMDAYPTSAGQTDVVFTVHWTLVGTDGTHTASVYGTVGVTYEAGSPFTEYSKLTLEQVTGWIINSLGEEKVTELEANVSNQIANLINPPVISPSLPWATA